MAAWCRFQVQTCVLEELSGHEAECYLPEQED